MRLDPCTCHTHRPRPLEIEVLRDGTWWPGFLVHWRTDGDRWPGNVRYTVGPGRTYVGWVDQDQVRLVG